MPHRGEPVRGLRGDQPVGAQVVVRGSIEVDEALLPQLHHGDRRDGLGEGADPKDRVLGDRCVRSDVGVPVSVEELQARVADHTYRQTDGRPAVEDPADMGPQLPFADPCGSVT